MILAAAYALWLYNRVVFGMPKPEYINSFSDLNRRELAMFLPLIICTLWMGIYPEVFLNEMHASVASLIQHGSFR
jgi:NADH-quinone oxidoreductase subunit M